jgi:hypothetical protein
MTDTVLPERDAQVVVDIAGQYQVVLYLNDQVHRVVDATGYSERYAQDIAENWCTGIIKS